MICRRASCTFFPPKRWPKDERFILWISLEDPGKKMSCFEVKKIPFSIVKQKIMYLSKCTWIYQPKFTIWSEYPKLLHIFLCLLWLRFDISRPWIRDGWEHFSSLAMSEHCGPAGIAITPSFMLSRAEIKVKGTKLLRHHLLFIHSLSRLKLF